MEELSSMEGMFMITDNENNSRLFENQTGSNLEYHDAKQAVKKI